MKLIQFYSIFFILILSSCNTKNKHDDIEQGWKNMEMILTNIVEPTFPDKQFVITDFGAKPDGAICTDAIRKAIKTCHEAGGGKVIVPKGEFLSGAIHLLSNVNLHLEDGAIIRFSTNPKDYLPVVITRSEGLELYNYSPLIYAYNQKNIAITGNGILDGQATKENWWKWRGREQFGWKEGMPSGHDPESFPRLFEMAEKGVPLEERIFGEGAYLRPSFIQPYSCKNVLIQGVTIKRPPMWVIHPVLTENITIRKVNVNSKNAPNGDGCDPECCKNVLIEDCVFSTGDDCIAIKSGRNRQGYELGIPTENVVIRNCLMNDGHGGITIGSELSGGVRNVYVYDCEMNSPDLVRALRIKSNKYRAGVVENIFLRNIKVAKIKSTAISINQLYSEKSDVVYSPEQYTIMRNIFVENMTVNESKFAIEIYGVESEKINNVKIIDCDFQNIQEHNVIENVEGFLLENVKFRLKKE